MNSTIRNTAAMIVSCERDLHALSLYAAGAGSLTPTHIDLLCEALEVDETTEAEETELLSYIRRLAANPVR